MTSRDEVFREILAAGPKGGSRPLMVGFCLLILVGVATFLIGISGEGAQRAWQAYLINFLFWTGLTSGTVLFSAILTLTNAKWGRPIKRIAEAPGTFLPVSFLLFWVLFLGRNNIFPWIHESVPGKEWWLNVSSLFLRDGVGLLLLVATGTALIYHSVKSDLEFKSSTEAERSEADLREGKSWRIQAVLSPVFVLIYAVILSLIAIDLIMTLDPHWVSTLFGAYFFMVSFYSALAAIIVLTVIASRTMNMERFIQPNIFHDLGKLLFGFCVVCGDFFYVQFLVIWYGNLPEETRYIILRLRQSPWELLSWTVLVVSFVFPFITLLSRKIKMKPLVMLVLSGVILIGIWLERVLLVAPSLWKGEQMPIGVIEVLISAGFLGIVGLCVLVFFQRFPILPVSDPLFHESIEAATAGGHG